MSPYKKYRKLGFALLFLLFNIAAFKFSELDAAAYSASITTSGMINLEVSASGNGTNVTKDELTINSTCPLGYTLSVSGPNDSALYKDGDKTSTAKINTSAGTKNNPASLINNKNTWGYATGSNITASSNFIGLTNTSVELTAKTSASITGGDKFSVFYGASVDATTPAGEYTLSESAPGAGDNKITYLLTANPACGTYYIRYNENGANSPSKMGNQTVTNTNADLTFWASNFKNPENKGFAGWNTKSDGTGTKYGPNETIPAENVQSFLETNAKVENGALYVDLYAMWIQSAGDLQNWNGCASMNVGDVTALKDARDNNTYAVAKLADKKCWMIENLRLDNTNSDNATGALAQGYAQSTTYGNFSGLAEPETANFTYSTTANSLYYSLTQSGTASINIGTRDHSGDRFPRFNNQNTTSAATLMNGTNGNTYSYGNWYTWAAAIADTSYYYINNQVISNTSICPKGWRLPVGGQNTVTVGQNGDFYVLTTTLTGEAPNNPNGGYAYYNDTLGTNASNKLRSFPNNFIYSGTFFGSSAANRGSGGEYWSSSAGGYDNYGHTLHFNSGLVYPGTSNENKPNGSSVRCVASDTYTIAFNSNGGSGTMASQTAYVGQNTNLNSNTFTAPTNLVFKGWNTAADGTGTSYTDVQSVTSLVATGQTITLYAQWVCIANTICYNDNGANSPTTMGYQTIDPSDYYIYLWSSNYQRQGYGFAGWGLKRNIITSECKSTNNGEECTLPSEMEMFGPHQVVKTYFGDNDVPAFQDLSDDGIVLYAIWVEPAKDSNGNILTFQTPNLLNVPLDTVGTLSSKPKGYVTALKDVRDGEVYAVAKLEDGNYWMIENLRLGGNAAMTLDSSTTNLVSGDTFILPASKDPAINAWCGFPNGTCPGSFEIFTGGTTNPITQVTGILDNMVYSYGNYYNWYAATAGYGTYSKTSGNTEGDICPAGWHLPTGGYGGDFSTLDISFGGNGQGGYSIEEAMPWSKYPNNFAESGYVSIYLQSVSGGGSGGNYWSSTAGIENLSGNIAAYKLNLSWNLVGPGTWTDSKHEGFTIRCIAGN